MKSEKLTMKNGIQVKSEKGKVKSGIQMRDGRTMRWLGVIFTLFILHFSLFTSCQSPFAPNENSVAGNGYFRLSINGAGTGRTIMPDLDGGFAAYELEFGGTANPPGTFNRTAADIGSPITLPTGTYNLTVTAFSAENVAVARGTLTGITISKDQTTSRSLVLSGIVGEGAGTFKWKITFPDDVTADMTIAPLSEGGSVQRTKTLASGVVSEPETLNSGYYRVIFNLNNGERAVSRVNYLHIYKGMLSYFEFEFAAGHFINYVVSDGGDNGDDVYPLAGTLRYVVTIAEEYSTIIFAVPEIKLKKRIMVNKSLSIEGGGVTITRDSSWVGSDGTTQLLYIDCDVVLGPGGGLTDPPEVYISRVHFTGGRSQMGGAICNYRGYLWLESCIFSDNNQGTSNGSGGAIYNNQFASGLTVSGCTFYNNSAAGGNAIANFSTAEDGYAIFTGNVFYKNGPSVAISPEAVYSDGGFEMVSGGYNVVDGEYGDLDRVFNVIASPTDVSIEAPILAPKAPFKVLSGSAAANIISPLPADYPETDFLGNTIMGGASAGAVQAFGVGFALETSSANESRGFVINGGEENEDGLYSGSLTITASPVNEGIIFLHWIVNGVKGGTTNPWTFTPSSHEIIQGVFGLLVNSTADDGSAGTLRYAVNGLDHEDIIWIDRDLDGPISIGSTLTLNKRNVTIEGNGAVLTRSGSMAASPLLTVNNDDGVTVIRRVHFKGGSATQGGAIINNGELALESCIFSGNASTGTGTTNGGGAIYNNGGTITAKACTFYQNTSVNRGSAIYQNGYLTLTGCLFYGNTHNNAGGMAVHLGEGATFSAGFNVIENSQGGWTMVASDKVISVPFFSTADPVQFRLLQNSAASNIITPLPQGYPSTDFYGVAIANNAAAGAVQTPITSNGYAVAFSVNDTNRGSISISGATADSFGLYSGTITLTTERKTATPDNHAFVGWTVNGVMEESSTMTKTITLSQHIVVQAIYGVIVDNFADDGERTLRAALTGTTANNDYIWFKGVTPGESIITLGSALPTINNRSVTIEGNGITITKGAGYTTSANSRLLNITGSATNTVKISRVHFKDGLLNGGYGAAIQCTSNLILESCIFSNNNNGSSGEGSAISLGNANVNLELYGCTVYGNRGYGFVIYSNSTSTTRKYAFIGNIFSNNSYGWSVGSPVWTGSCFNVGQINLPISGFGKQVSFGVVLSPSNNLKPIAGGEAVNVLTSIPAGYPAKDFYGVAITAPAAAGAIQTTVVTNSYAFELEQSSGGTAVIDSEPDADGLYSGEVIVTATATAPAEFVHWLVNGVKVEGEAGADNTNTLTIQLDASKRVRPVFYVFVTKEIDDDSVGTLRWALDNANAPIMYKVSVIQLDRPLSFLNKSISIDGDGMVIMPSANYEGGALLNITASSSLNGSISARIYNVHFKNAQGGVITVSGASSGTYYGGVDLYLYSCIFSENTGRVISSTSSYVHVNLYGCTFYHNNAGTYSELMNQGSTDNWYFANYTIQGCLFYGNYGNGSIKLLSYPTTGDAGVNALNRLSLHYNVVDVPLGTGYGQAGWPATSGTNITNNKTLAELGVSGDPLDPVTFKPKNSALITGYSNNQNYSDFYSKPRNGTVGAVNY